jgi:hypothetical protein
MPTTMRLFAVFLLHQSGRRGGRIVAGCTVPDSSPLTVQINPPCPHAWASVIFRNIKKTMSVIICHRKRGLAISQD